MYCHHHYFHCSFYKYWAFFSFNFVIYLRFFQYVTDTMYIWARSGLNLNSKCIFLFHLPTWMQTPWIISVVICRSFSSRTKRYQPKKGTVLFKWCQLELNNFFFVNMFVRKSILFKNSGKMQVRNYADSKSNKIDVHAL